MKTTKIKKEELKDKAWHVLDAKNVPLGKLASEAARLLRGKHKASFVPHWDCGDYVIVVNAHEVCLTGRKWEQKTYYHHSTHIGGLKQRKAFQRKSEAEKMIEEAVQGMLPKNALARHVAKKLKVYPGEEHPHKAHGAKMWMMTPIRGGK